MEILKSKKACMRVISIVPFLRYVRRVTDSWIHLMRKYAINVVTVRKLLVIRVTVCEANTLVATVKTIRIHCH